MAATKVESPLPEHYAQRLLSTESAARAKLQRRVSDLEEQLREAVASAIYHRTQRDALHSQVLTLGLPNARRVSSGGGGEYLGPMEEASDAARVVDGSATVRECAYLKQTVTELRQQVVEATSCRHAAAARASQLQQDLADARGVIDQLQSQLQQMHAQHTNRFSLPWGGGGSPMRSTSGSNAAEGKLKARLQQVEAERAQYLSVAEELQRRIQRQAERSNGAVPKSPVGGAAHGGDTANAESVQEEGASMQALLLRSLVDEMLWLTSIQLRTATAGDHGDGRGELREPTPPSIAPHAAGGGDDGGASDEAL